MQLKIEKIKSSLSLLLLVVSLTLVNTDADVRILLNENNNQFSGKMLNALAEIPGTSKVLSAFSLLSPLGLLAAASNGPTHDEILKAIGFKNNDALQSAISFINNKNSDHQKELTMANRIYVALDKELNTNFANLAKNTYKSEIQKVDFTQNTQTAASINNWVEENTNHRIKDLIDPSTLGPDTRMMLVNTIYFKGVWKYQFEKRGTRNGQFRKDKNTEVQVPLMRTSGTFYFAESPSLKAKVLELPYTGNNSSLVIVLPNEVDGIQSLLAELNDLSVLQKIEMIDTKIDPVIIPKFKIETTTDLKDTLEKLNIISAFGNEANFANLFTKPDDVFVSKATQKAFIEVNEEGTEAAAGNDLEFTLKMGSLDKIFVADHPFVFLVKNNDNFIFSGVYYA